MKNKGISKFAILVVSIIVIFIAIIFFIVAKFMIQSAPIGISELSLSPEIYYFSWTGVFFEVIVVIMLVHITYFVVGRWKRLQRKKSNRSV